MSAMLHHRVLVLLCLTVVLLAGGCSVPSTDSLRGKTETDVLKKYGQPESRFGPWEIGKEFFGPRPGELKPGEEFLSLQYRIGDDIYSVFMVSPQVYQRVTGTHPGTASWYVLEVDRASKGVEY